MIIGYARVSTTQQDLGRQLKALRDQSCDAIYSDKASGKSLANRPKLKKILSELCPGDILVVAEWDRATRSMVDGLTIVTSVAERGALIKVLDKPHLDLTTTVGKGMLALFSALAQDERERIIKRSLEGRAIAKAAGRNIGGPKFKLTREQRRRILERKAAGEPLRAIAADMRVSTSTISRIRSIDP